MADELHARSRALLVGAVRAGAAAGLSQREIAAAIGRSQPEVSRLLRFHAASPRGADLARRRRDVISLAKRHGAQNVRVFGSVAHGTDGPSSDIDLLVDTPDDMSLFALARLELDLEGLLGSKVDVVSASGLREPMRDRILDEAIPL